MEFKYDLAISLLDEDAQIGWDIVDKLGNPDKTFFYKKDIDEITFTNGVNVFSDIFSKYARFVLVLYRENYGNTDWTAIEYSIIQERFKRTIKTNNSPILFCKLDTSPNPTWLPETYIYFKVTQIDELVRLIQKKITDFGGTAFPQTAEERLKVTLAKNKYEETFQRKVFLNQELADEARLEASNLKDKLFNKLEKSASENNLCFRDNTEQIYSNVSIATLSVIFDSISVYLKDNQLSTNSIDGAFIEVIIHKQQQKLKQYKKKFYITSNNIYGWRDMDNSNFLTTESFVETIFQDLVNIIS
jgi:hypothetical protein